MIRLAAASVIGPVLMSCATPSPIASPSVAELPTDEPAATASPRPETASDLLECDGPVDEAGGRADQFGPSGGGDTADEAFESFLADPLFPIPRDGYERIGAVGDRSVYAFSRDGAIKVVVVVSGRFGEMVGRPFTVEEVRMCPVGEFGAADFGPGRRSWVHETTGDIVTDTAGPAHCKWQSARMLHIEKEGRPVRQYLRDPEGVFGFADLLDSYAEGVELPADATDSGYRSPEGHELWFTPGDRAAYVVTADGVERWPRAEAPIGCA